MGCCLLAVCLLLLLLTLSAVVPLTTNSLCSRSNIKIACSNVRRGNERVASALSQDGRKMDTVDATVKTGGGGFRGLHIAWQLTLRSFPLVSGKEELAIDRAGKRLESCI